MTNLKDTLIQSYMDDDKEILLVGDNFSIPLKLQIINTFVPVMKKYFETELNQDRNEEKRCLKIDAAFDKKQQAVCKNSNRKNINYVGNLKWDVLVRLLKFCHFYQVREIITKCYSSGLNKITLADGLVFRGMLANDRINKNFTDAVELMVLLGFNDWIKPIAFVSKML